MLRSWESNVGFTRASCTLVIDDSRNGRNLSQDRSARTLAGRSYRVSPTSFQGSLPALENVNISLIQRKHARNPNQDSILTKADPVLTALNPTSSAQETALVCQSRYGLNFQNTPIQFAKIYRTSKLSTRSRKRMKIPARSNRVSRTTFIFVSNVRPVLDTRTTSL
jgi:hypothetical protein